MAAGGGGAVGSSGCRGESEASGRRVGSGCGSRQGREDEDEASTEVVGRHELGERALGLVRSGWARQLLAEITTRVMCTWTGPCHDHDGATPRTVLVRCIYV